MPHLGDYSLTATQPVRFPWNTQDATGNPATPSSVGTTYIYKDGSVIPRSVLDGVVETIDFANVVGSHQTSIDITDNTDPSFYSAGSEYKVDKVGIIVDGISVNTTLATFSIERASGSLALLKSTAFGLEASKTALDLKASQASVDLKASQASVDLKASQASVDLKASQASVDALAGSGGLTGPQAAQLTAIEAKTAPLPTDPADQSLLIQATDAIMTRLGAPALASLSADIAAIPPGGLTGPQAAQLTAIASAADPTGAADIDLIRAKTDQLTFTTPGQVNATAIGVDNSAILAAIDTVMVRLGVPTLGTIVADIAAGGGAAPSAAAIAEAIMTAIVEGAVTVRDSHRLANSANAGKVSGMGTSVVRLRDLADTKDRVVASVDATGNRSTVVTDTT